MQIENQNLSSYAEKSRQMTDPKCLRMDHQWRHNVHGALIRSPAGCIVAVLLAPGLCLAESFDCNRATSMIEKLVCSQHCFTQLDAKRTKAYQEVLGSAPAPGIFAQAGLPSPADGDGSPSSP